MPSLNEFRKRFDKIAPDYDDYAILHHELAKRLCERFHFLKIEPHFILDIGAGTGILTQRIQKIYPKAQVMALDSSHQMLLQAKKKRAWFHRFKLLEGNAELLPLASHSVDLIVSNALLPYVSNIDDFLKECHRVLKPEGLLMFSSFGPDTFKEWRKAFKSINSLKHTHDFMDLHDIGDALLKAGFSDPVMDRADICLHYPSFEKMRHSMRKQGIGHISSEEIKSINQEERQRLKDAYSKVEGKYPLTYEVVFGHAWRIKDEVNKNVISLTHLKQLLPSKK